ncbi:MAG: peptidoglycan bridge formation glycyltransferase FemA/FemB family protein [Candidatus Magasanikbacteria bacterium]|nr:peptidoglycan bridge formation glycyltransferase FemA/FemB family protein [Candidatus Magasanikbacteria bacterium]
MEIISVHNETQWDAWLLQQGDASFLQSFAWGEILIAEGKQVERLAVVEDGETLLQAQVVYTQLPLGWQYAFCPKGPVLNVKCQMSNVKSNPNDQIYKTLVPYLKSKKCIFFRVEPLQATSYKLQANKVIDLNPRATSVLDLGKSAESLLVAMHEKTRYNIRLAQKKELTVRLEKNLKNFLLLSRKTAQRDGFRLHPEEHYQNILASPFVQQITLYSKEIPVASAIFVGFGKVFTYLFGASDHGFRNLMAPHLLQWEGIKLGKKLGYRQYDFFGIAPHIPPVRGVGGCEPSGIIIQSPGETPYQYDQKHQYAGVTRFKLGFGGEIIEAPGTFDLIISPVRYRIYQVLRKLRRLV